jgi:hypothetical protein
MNNELKTPEEWCKLTGIIILDPDGWDRSAANFDNDWNKKIAFDEFYYKAAVSTTKGMRDRDVYMKELGL